MSALLAPIAGAFFDAVAPLEGACSDPIQFRLLIRDLGWDVELESSALQEIPLASSIPPLLARGQALKDEIDGGQGDLAAATTDLLEVVDDVVSAIQQLDGFQPPTTLPAELRDLAFWADVARLLPGYSWCDGSSRTA